MAWTEWDVELNTCCFVHGGDGVPDIANLKCTQNGDQCGDVIMVSGDTCTADVSGQDAYSWVNLERVFQQKT